MFSISPYDSLVVRLTFFRNVDLKKKKVCLSTILMTLTWSSETCSFDRFVLPHLTESYRSITITLFVSSTETQLVTSCSQHRVWNTRNRIFFNCDNTQSLHYEFSSPSTDTKSASHFELDLYWLVASHTDEDDMLSESIVTSPLIQSGSSDVK